MTEYQKNAIDPFSAFSIQKYPSSKVFQLSQFFTTRSKYRPLGLHSFTQTIARVKNCPGITTNITMAPCHQIHSDTQKLTPRISIELPGQLKRNLYNLSRYILIAARAAKKKSTQPPIYIPYLSKLSNQVAMPGVFKSIQFPSILIMNILEIKQELHDLYSGSSGSFDESAMTALR